MRCCIIARLGFHADDGWDDLFDERRNRCLIELKTGWRKIQHRGN